MDFGCSTHQQADTIMRYVSTGHRIACANGVGGHAVTAAGRVVLTGTAVLLFGQGYDSSLQVQSISTASGTPVLEVGQTGTTGRRFVPVGFNAAIALKERVALQPARTKPQYCTLLWYNTCAACSVLPFSTAHYTTPALYRLSGQTHPVHVTSGPLGLGHSMN
eukprot:1974557-Rhodomonas_salina.2